MKKMRGINSDKPQMKTVSYDEMWTRVGARLGENRQSVRIWTASVEGWNDIRRSDFEVGYRDAETFLRLPKAAKYRSRPLLGVQLPAVGSPRKGEGGDMNRNEGLRSKLKVKLNRLVRRTHGCSATVHAGRVACDGAALRDGLY